MEYRNTAKENLLVVTCVQNQQLSQQEEFTASSRDPHVEKNAFYCPDFGSKKCCYSKRWISLTRKFPFPHKFINCTRDYGFKMGSSVCLHHPFLPTPHRFTLKSLHSSIPFSTKCDFSPLPAHFWLISHLNTNFPGLVQFALDGSIIFILFILVLLLWKEEIV